jgi:hypothetical protein
MDFSLGRFYVKTTEKDKVMIRNLLFHSFLYFFWAYSFFNPVFCDSIPQGPENMRVAWEMELTRTSLANIIDDFDFEKLQREKSDELEIKIPPEFYNDYILNKPDVLDDLPLLLKAELTKNLILERPVLVIPTGNEENKNLSSPQSIILENVNDVEVDTKKEIILPGDGKILTGGRASPRHFQDQNGIEIPKSVAWQTLHKRWNRLDLKVKKSVVKWEKVSRKKRCHLATYLAQGALRPKENLRPSLTKLYNKLEWENDGDTLEFRYKNQTIVKDFNELMNDITQFSQRVGNQKQILNQEIGQLKSSSLHVHVSIQGKDLRPHASLINDFLFLRGVGDGVIDDLITMGTMNTYNLNLERWGLVRVIDDDHFEVRENIKDLKKDITFINEMVALDPLQARDLMKEKVKEYVSDFSLDKIAKYNSLYLSRFRFLMNDNQKSRYQNKFEMVAWAEKLDESVPDNFWEEALPILKGDDAYLKKRVIFALGKHQTLTWTETVWQNLTALLVDPDRDVSFMASDLLSKRLELPSSFWEEVGPLLKNADIKEMRILMKTLSLHQNWPSYIWNTLLEILENSHDKIIAHIIPVIHFQQNWPAGFMSNITKLALKKNRKFQREVIKSMGEQTPWPEELWPLVSDHLNSSLSSVKKEIIYSMYQQEYLPDNIWMELINIIKGTDENLIQVVINNLTRKKKWPTGIWSMVPVLLSNSYPIQVTMISALENQKIWPGPVWDVMNQLVTDKNIWIQENILLILGKRQDWSISFWEKVPYLLVETDFVISKMFMEIIAEQENIPTQFYEAMELMRASILTKTLSLYDDFVSEKRRSGCFIPRSIIDKIDESKIK